MSDDKQDWAAELAAELLPCNSFQTGNRCGKDVDTDEFLHGFGCQARRASAVFAALREAEARGYARGLETGAKIADCWEVTLRATVSCSNGEVPVALQTDGREVGKLIRALKG